MKQNFTEILNTIKENTKKLENTNIEIEEAIKIYEANIELIKVAKTDLDNAQNKVYKVLEDNKIQEFEE